MRLMQKIGEWLDARLQIGGAIRETMEHPVPREIRQLVLRLRQRRASPYSCCRSSPASCWR